MKTFMTFAEWAAERGLLSELNADGTDDMGQVIDQAAYKRAQLANRRGAATDNASIQSRDVNAVQDASRFAGQWMEQPNVKLMLMRAYERGESIAQNPAFIAVMQAQRYSQQVIQKVAEVLTNKLAYYRKMMPVAQVAKPGT